MKKKKTTDNLKKGGVVQVPNAEKQMVELNKSSVLPFLFVFGLSGNACKNKLDGYCKKIIEHRYAGTVKVDRWIGEMEKKYNRYRSTNPKYQNELNSDNSISQGVLDYYRDCLKSIVLSESVRTENKETALKLLLAQHSNKALYNIAVSYMAAGKDTSNAKKRKKATEDKTIVDFILKSFPKNCDQDLINLSSHFATRSDNSWAATAIKRLESPKSLSIICTTFRDNQTDLNCVQVAIECLGEKIQQSLKAIEQYNRGKPEHEVIDCTNADKFNPEDRSTWKIEGEDAISHELSMLYSAHTALGNVVIEYANKSDRHLTPSLRDRETVFYKQALDTMEISGFISKIIPRISTDDTEKSHCCYERLIKLGSCQNDVYREVIHKNLLDPGMICLAINEIDLSTPGNQDTKAILVNYISDKAIDDNMRFASCKKIYGEHDFQPDKDSKKTGYEVCTRCGAKHTIPNVAT